MPAEALPGNLFSELDQPDAYKAYEMCLSVEKTMMATRLTKQDAFNLIAPRLLGRVLLCLDANKRFDGRDKLAEEVHKCKDDEAVIALAHRYKQHFVKVFYRSSGPTPQPSPHRSVPELDVEKEEYTEMLRNATLDHRAGKSHALKRDNYACIFSHVKHSGWVSMHPDYDGFHSYTTAAHIIPESTNSNISQYGGKKHHQEVWRILSMFGERELPAELNGSGIHCVENILTLTHDIHQRFDRLDLWLKAIPGEQHKYRVCASANMWLQGVPDYVEFTAAADYALPDARFIELHALACESAHMSGAADYINDIYRDLEDDSHVLAQDGSSADLLISYLSLVAPAQ